MEPQKKGINTNMTEWKKEYVIDTDPKKYATTGTITKMILGINSINMFSYGIPLYEKGRYPLFFEL